VIDRVWLPPIDRARYADILARCDGPARETLELAQGLARTRLAQQAQITLLVEELRRPPWAEAAVGWREPVHALTSTDLLRALLATHGARIAEVAFRSVDETYRELVAACRALVPSAGADLELEPVWARCWNLTTELDRDGLLGQLSERCVRHLATYSERYCEGLITDDEAFNDTVDHLAHGPGWRLRFARPAYYDRHDGLAALDRALLEAPGAIVVGPRGAGRTALLAAWGMRRPPALARHGYNIDNFHGAGEDLWNDQRVPTWAAIDAGLIAAIPDLDRFLEHDYAPDRRFPAYVVDFARKHDFKLILELTHEGLARLAQDVSLDGFPRIEVPPIVDADELPIWICQLPRIEPVLGFELSLARLVDRLATRPLDRLRAYDEYADLAADSRTDHERLLARTAPRAVLRRPEVAALVGDAARWPQLVALTSAMHP
jgi:hypothetical protein